MAQATTSRPSGSLAENSAESKAPLPRVPFAAWWALAVLFLMYVLSYVDRYLLTMLVEPIQADLGISDLQMGLVLGPAFGVALGLFGIPLGWAADRFPRRWVIFLGVSFWSAATAACGLASSGAGLFAARVGVGVGEAALSPAATSLLADKFPRHRLTLAISVFQSGVKVGQAAAFAIGGLLIGAMAGATYVLPLLGEVQPWQIVFLVVGAPGILLGLLAFTFAEPARTGRTVGMTSTPGAALRYLKANAGLYVLLFGGFCCVAFCAFALGSWVPTYMSRRWGWAPEHYGPAIGMINLLAALTLVFKGALVDWLFSRGLKDAQVRFYSWLLIGTTPIALLLFFIPNPWVFLVIYGVMQVVTIPSMMYLSSTLSVLVPAEVRGQVLAVGYTLYNVLGLGIGPIAVGALTDLVFRDPQKIGWSLAVVLAVTIPLAAIVLRIALRPLGRALDLAEAARITEAARP